MIDKKEIKRNYKQTLRPMGIYQIKNLVNGKVFIGSTKNIDAKINAHKFTLEVGSHINKELQNDYNNCGKEYFSFEVLELVKPKEDHSYDYSNDLKELEKKWIQKLQPFNEAGYNKE